MVGFILLHGVLPVVIFALAFLIEKKYAKASLQENMSQLWTQASLLKTLYIIFAIVIGFALFVLFVNLYSVIISLEWGGKPRADGTLAPINIQNLALAFIGTVSGLGALFGVFLAIRRTEESKRQSDSAEIESAAARLQSEIANRQADTAEQGLITDRLNKAVEGLGKTNQKDEPVIAVRLGALYALERIAQDSLRDHVQIMKILCAYIRTNSKLDNSIDLTKPLRADIGAAINIIAGRDKLYNGKKRIQMEKKQEYHIDLRDCDLRGADLFRANLTDAWIGGTNLNKAGIIGANLSGALLININLSGALLANTDLKGTTTKISFAYTGDFSECKNLTQKQVNQMFLGQAVKLPKNLKHPQKNSKYNKLYNTPEDFMEAREEWIKETFPT